MSEMRELTTTELDAVGGGWGGFHVNIGNFVGNLNEGQNVQAGVNNGVNFGNQVGTQTNINMGGSR